MKSKLTFHLYFLFLVIIFSITSHSFAQSRLVLGNGTAVYMNISGGAYLVIGDATASANPNTITRAANAWIISEGDGTINNRIKWYIGNAAATTTYTIPFGRSTTNYIPLSLTVGSAGTAGGAIVFSTYRTANCTNSANLPTTGSNPPTNYNSPAIPGDASNYGVDRFWEVDGASYGASKPDLSSLVFTYIQAEVDGITCTNTGLNEASLQAQRWNSTAATPSWQGTGNTFIKGTCTPASDIVTLSGATVVSGANDIATSRWWALQGSTKPLPVTWLSQSAICNQGTATIKWSTASEEEVDFFSVERSRDGVHFIAITNVTASGNSSSIKNYSYVDTDPSTGVSYYRICETDFNANKSFSEILMINGCSKDNVIISGGDNEILITIHATEESTYAFEIYDAIGQKLVTEVKTMFTGNNILKIPVGSMGSGIYVVKAYSAANAIMQKVFVCSE
jgi:hypothetical protein